MGAKPHLKQIIPVVIFSLIFTFGGWAAIVLLLYLLFTKYWFVTALYSLWWLYDYYVLRTQVRGGRRKMWMRRWNILPDFQDYFPLTLIKTSDLDPERNYIFGCHPHGVMCCAPFFHFCAEASPFQEKYPGLKPYLMSLSIQYQYPFFREFMMSFGAVDVCKEGLAWLLDSAPKGGVACAIVVGGAAEVLVSGPGRSTLQIKERKGFVKMALQHGASLVPAYTFGENDLFEVEECKEGSWMMLLQKIGLKLFGYTLPVIYGATKWFPIVPKRKPLYTVVGKPIHVEKVQNPSRDQVQELHARYLQALSDLFEEYKHLSPNIPENQPLTII